MGSFTLKLNWIEAMVIEENADSTAEFLGEAPPKNLVMQSHYLCAASLDSAQSDRLPERQNRLPNQARNAVRLLDCTTQASLCSNDPCVSPDKTKPYYAGKVLPITRDFGNFQHM